jgi:hypothetical protein
VAINGTSWLAFRRGVRVRVGVAITPAERVTHESVGALTRQVEAALLAMTADFADPPRPGGRFARLTEWFNDWPEGARPELGAGDGAAYVAGLRERDPAGGATG